jgi:hypothetical protein
MVLALNDKYGRLSPYLKTPKVLPPEVVEDTYHNPIRHPNTTAKGWKVPALFVQDDHSLDSI